MSSAALGAVLGEALGSFIAVPWALTWLCVPGDRYNVATVFLLRLVAVMSALGAWRSERVGDSARLRMDRVAVLASAALMLLVALQQWDGGRSLLGHRPSKEVLAETKAVEQLGPEYADYQFFSRGLRPVFREGRSVTWRASLIAYSTEYRDVLDVDVTWTEPWDQPD